MKKSAIAAVVFLSAALPALAQTTKFPALEAFKNCDGAAFKTAPRKLANGLVITKVTAKKKGQKEFVELTFNQFSTDTESQPQLVARQTGYFFDVEKTTGPVTFEDDEAEHLPTLLCRKGGVF